MTYAWLMGGPWVKSSSEASDADEDDDDDFLRSFLMRDLVQSWKRLRTPAMTSTGVPRARAQGL